MKRIPALVLVFCLLPMFVLGVVSVLDAGETVSELEQRTLGEKPAFSWSALFAGTYTRALEDYYADTFPLRDVFLRASTALGHFYYFNAGEEAILVVPHQGADPDVGGIELSGEADAVPSVPETPASQPPVPEAAPPKSTPEGPAVSPSETPAPTAPIDYPEMSEVVNAGNIVIIGDRAMEIPYVNKATVTRYAGIMNAVVGALPGVQVYALTTPNAGEFYSPVSMHSGTTSQRDMIALMYGQLASGVRSVDAHTVLSRHTDEYIFFRTDHHWTALGAYYAYTAFCESAGLSYSDISEFTTGVYENFVGSMYGFTAKYPQSRVLRDNPDSLTYYLPIVPSTATVYSSGRLEDGRTASVVSESISASYGNKYICFIDGDNPLSVVRSENGSGRSIVVVKESYGNAFVPFLTSHYETIYVVDPRHVNGKGQPSLNLLELIRTQNIDDALFINYPFSINSAGYCSMLERLTEGAQNGGSAE
ncbi:MAG: hypothetical protein LBK75_04390 [Oscillospiraceae bacterium]|nr:hypothetical protein [Oscillospiraceae bacterium]